MRYYVLPNAGHSGDGASLTTGEPIPHRIDMIGMMTDWVEEASSLPMHRCCSTMERCRRTP